MRQRRLLLLLAWTAGLVVAVVLLGRAGHGALTPPSADPGDSAAWAGGREPVDVAFALLLLVSRLLASYLLAATVLSVTAALSGRRWLARVAARLTGPVLTRMVVGALGMTLVGVAAGVAPSPRSGPAPVLIASAEPLPAGDAPVMHRLASDPAPPPAGDPPPVVRDWEVAAGDHLWSVAARVLHEAWGRVPSDREVTPYWSVLVEDNRPRLADPANPDLVFPGQRLSLPAPPPAP